MNRTERYCDVCGAQMTYRNSDGDTAQQGIMLTYAPTATVVARNSCGQSTSQRAQVGIDFCSVSCFDEAVDAWKAQVRTAAKNLEPLK